LTLTGTVTTSGNLTLGGTLDLSSPPAIGGTAASAGSFTTLSASSTTTLSGGTANGVAYLNGSKVVTTGSALTFDGTNFASTGSLTGSTLKTTRASGAQPEIVLTQTSVASWSIYNPPSSTDLRFYNGSDLLTLNSSGNLGLGVTPSAWYVASANARTFQINNAGFYADTGNSVFLSSNYLFGTSGSETFIASGYANKFLINSGQFRWLTSTASGSAGGAATMTQAMTLDASGNLGIGSTTPSSTGIDTGVTRLFVVAPNSNTGAAATFVSDSVGRNTLFSNQSKTVIGALNVNDTAVSLGTNTAYPLVFATNGSERARIDSSGNFGVGTTSPRTKLDVSGNIYVAAGNQIQITGSAGSTGLQLIGNDASDSTIGTMSAQALVLRTNSTERARIDSSGNFLVGTTSTTNGSLINWYKASGTIETSLGGTTAAQNHIVFANPNGNVGSIQVAASLTTYNATSDYRLKNVIGAVSNSGERIDALEPIEYTWKVDGLRTRGFLAHKFQEVYPHSVNGEKDAVDEEGNPQYQTMQASTAEVIADLVAEIQSLRVRVAQLETN
jgi:hypothetical protein